MGRKLQYKPGSHYRVDDRTGFPQRAERTREQWDNLIVDEKVWEPRQPQDFVRGTADNQTVALPRPISDPIFIGPIYVQMTLPALVGAVDIYVNSLAGLTVGDRVAVMQDNGEDHVSTLVSISGAFVTISSGLACSAQAGNLLCDYRTPG